MAQNFTTDVTQWQGVDDVPTTTNNSFGDSSSTYTGSASTGTKYLYVKSDATGYEGTTGTGWSELLDTTKCNFKISKTI